MAIPSDIYARPDYTKLKSDDYFLLVYRVLAYLYGSLKTGKSKKPEALAPCSARLPINKKYWSYLMNQLFTEGYVDGLRICRMQYEKNGTDIEYADIGITPRGIEYLLFDHKMRGIADWIGEDFGDK